jgi:hypothetical protein
MGIWNRNTSSKSQECLAEGVLEYFETLIERWDGASGVTYYWLQCASYVTG